MKYFSSFFCVVLVLLFSCKPQKQMAGYVHDIRDTMDSNINIPELLIQRNDLLAIQVYSASTKPETDLPFNLPCATASGNAQGGAGASPCGFLVDASGNIEYPTIGLVHVQGLTKQQLSSVIKRRINEKDSVLTNPTVIVRFQNLKVTVMGEVKAPGVQTFPGERVTILEAIGLAGDLTDYGVRDRIKIIRETNGKRETATVDLTSTTLFNSPYYNLIQNDVILVDATSRKTKQQDEAVVYQKIGLGLSIVTAIALIYSVFK